MAEFTQNLKLEKPLGGENFKRRVLNTNMEKLDKMFGVEQGDGHSHNGTAGQGKRISYNDLVDKPDTTKPALHKATHAIGGSDAITPADIGAETPQGAQAKVDIHVKAAQDPHPQYAKDTDLSKVQSRIDAHMADRAVHVQLYNGTDSTSATLGATANAVKTAMDKANQAFQQANDGKTAVANAVTAKGVSASSTDTFPTLATKIEQIKTGKKWAIVSQPYSGEAPWAFLLPDINFIPSFVVAIFNSSFGINGYSSFGSFVGAVTSECKEVLTTPHGATEIELVFYVNNATCKVCIRSSGSNVSGSGTVTIYLYE